MIRKLLCLVLLCLASCAVKEEDGADMMSLAAYADTECGSCALARCTKETEACGADPGCARYQRCLLGCRMEDGEPAANCAAACAEGVNSGLSQIRALTGCLVEAAPSCPCGKPPPPLPPILAQKCPAPDDKNPDLCGRCENAKCCETFAAYKANCWARCIFSCMQDCNAKYPKDRVAGAQCDLACTKSPSCPKLTECTPTPHPDAMRLVAERLACLRFQCPGPGACATPDACVKCLDGECRAASLAVEMHPACYVERLCDIASECGSDPACYGRCASQYPGCGNRITALVNCAQRKCMICRPS